MPVDPPVIRLVLPEVFIIIAKTSMITFYAFHENYIFLCESR